MAKITDYPSITTIDANTILLADGSSGTGKILASDMAKYALETYAGSTLAGEAQSVKNAFETAGKDCFSLYGGTQVESRFNFDTCLTVGNYYIPTTALADSTTGVKPINSPIGFLKVLKIRKTANFTTQMFFVYDQLGSPYVRNHMNSTGEWSEWLRVPTRGEFKNAVISSGTPETVTASTDINNYTTPGTFFFNSPTKAANAPDTSGYFRLVVTAPTGELSGTNRVRYQEAITSTGVAYIRVLRSSNGGSTWTAEPWKNDGISKITTSITDYVDSMSDNSLIKLWSSASDGTKVGSPFGTSFPAYYEIDKINASTAYVKAKAMAKGVADQDVVYVKQKYGSGWADNWTKVPTRTEVDALSTRIAGASYSSLAGLYAAGIATSGYKVAVISSGVASALSGGAISTSSRVLMFKVDANVVDILCFALATGAVYLSRLTDGEVTKSFVVYKETPTEGTFTPDSSLTNLGENGVKVWQSGKVVTVGGYLQASFPGATNIQVGAISGVGVPQNPIRARGGCGPNAYTTGNDAYVAITREGKVTAYSAGAGTSLYFAITYITA